MSKCVSVCVCVCLLLFGKQHISDWSIPCCDALCTHVLFSQSLTVSTCSREMSYVQLQLLLPPVCGLSKLQVLLHTAVLNIFFWIIHPKRLVFKVRLKLLFFWPKAKIIPAERHKKIT